jgi:hypothetical protein
MFVPGYQDGQAPYGRFTARLGVADATWLRNDQQHGEVYNTYDQGFLVLNPNEDGQRVQDAVGAAQRIGFDEPGDARVAEFGYPRAASDPARDGLPEYTGARLAYCEGTAKEYPGTADMPDAPDQWGAPCTMGGGSSGGPRIEGLSPESGLGTVVGDNTHAGFFDASGQPCPVTAPGDCTRYLVGPRFSHEVTEPLYTRAQHD